MMNSSRWIASAVALAVAVVSAAPLALQQVEKKEYPGVRNFSRVDATIACGGATTPEAMAALKKDGFVSVVNLRRAEEAGANVEAEKAAAEAAGVRYFHLPFNASAPATDLVDRFIATVTDKQNQPVFIHCASANRVAALWLIKRVKVDGWPVQKALDEATAIGLTSDALKKFALDYIEKTASPLSMSIPQTKAISPASRAGTSTVTG
jgi:uncharacterized protein (TIGR01244 family)